MIKPITDTCRRYTVVFTSDEEQCDLKRMKNIHMISDYKTKDLNQYQVQLLNTMFANKKKQLDCFSNIVGVRKSTTQN